MRVGRPSLQKTGQETLSYFLMSSVKEPRQEHALSIIQIHTNTLIWRSVLPFSVLMSSYLMEIDLTTQSGVWPHAPLHTNTNHLHALSSLYEEWELYTQPWAFDYLTVLHRVWWKLTWLVCCCCFLMQLEYLSLNVKNCSLNAIILLIRIMRNVWK